MSLEEVEGGMKGMKLQSGPQARRVPQQARGDGIGTPFMAEHLEEALTGGSSARPRSRDPDMSAFNKLVSSMKASGTLPTCPKGGTNNVSIPHELLFKCFHIAFNHSLLSQRTPLSLALIF